MEKPRSEWSDEELISAMRSALDAPWDSSIQRDLLEMVRRLRARVAKLEADAKKNHGPSSYGEGFCSLRGGG